MNSKLTAYFQLHIAVLLFGFTAIMGRLIEMQETIIVWYRLLFTCLSLLFVPQVWHSLRAMSAKRYLALIGIGIIVSLHWVMFYGAVKYSNVSVTLSCMATASFFTALVEPAITRKKVKPYELGLGLLVIPGIYLIFYFSAFYLTGILMGLAAALLASIFASLNKKMVAKQDALSMTFVELGGGLLFLTLIMPGYLKFFPSSDLIPGGFDLFYLLLLALLCTTFAYVLSIHALKHLSAFSNALTINLEPVYGIFLAVLIFQENQEMDNRFYLGTLLVLFAVFLHPVIESYFQKKSPPD